MSPGSNVGGVVVDRPLGHLEAEEEEGHRLLGARHQVSQRQSHTSDRRQKTGDRSSAAPKEEKEEEKEEKEKAEAGSGSCCCRRPLRLDPPPGARSCLALIATSARAQSALLLTKEEAMQLHAGEQVVEEEGLGTWANACPTTPFMGDLVAGMLGLLDSMPSPHARALTADLAQGSTLVAAAFRDRVREIAQMQKDLTDLVDIARLLLEALPSPHARALASDLARARTPISAALRERASTPLLPPDNAPGAADRGQEGRELLLAGPDGKSSSCVSAGNDEVGDARGEEGGNGGGDDEGDGVHASAATASIVPPPPPFPPPTTLPNMHPVFALPCTDSAALLALVLRPTNTETDTDRERDTQGEEGREMDTRVGSEAEVDVAAVDEALEVRSLKEDAALHHLVSALVHSALRSI